MKRIISLIFVFTVLASLSSCYKSETVAFAETVYVLKDQAAFDEVRSLNEVKLSLTEITKDEYTALSKTNVIASRYDNKFYKTDLTLNIDGIEYDNITTREIPGSSAYPNRYWFVFDLTIDTKTYPCNFRMDLFHYSWESEEIEEDAATSIHVDIFEAIDEEGKTRGKFAQFQLIDQGLSTAD